MKKKTHIFKHLFLFCLLAMAVAFANPTGHTTVSAAKKASYKIINKKETRKNNKLTGTYLYQLTQLKGKSAAVKRKRPECLDSGAGSGLFVYTMIQVQICACTRICIWRMYIIELLSEMMYKV